MDEKFSAPSKFNLQTSRSSAAVQPPASLASSFAARLAGFRLWLAQHRQPLSLFLGWRLALGLLSFLAGAFIPAFASRNGVAPAVEMGPEPWQERLLGVWSHWDGEWFLHVAKVGYLPNEPTAPYFPLYPLLTRLLAGILGQNYLLAGVLVGGFASLLVFWLLYDLVRHEFGRVTAARTTLYLAVFPTSFFLTACFSEGLFLALALGAFLAARRYSNWWLAGLLAGLAAITRNHGILLLLPLGWEWWRQHHQFIFERRPEKKGWRLNIKWAELQPLDTLLLVSWPLALFGSWLIYQWVELGNPLKFLALQSEWMWDRHFSWPWDTVRMSVTMLLNGSGRVASQPPGFFEDHNALDFGFWVFLALVFLVACWQSWRKRLPFTYLIFFAIALVMPMFSPSLKEPFISYPRYSLAAFPAFIVLAQLGRRWPFFHYLYLMSGLFLLALLFSKFANWYWIA